MSLRKKRLMVGLVTLFGLTIIALAWAVSYRPVEIVGETPSAGPYSLPPPVSGLKLHVFNTGMNRMSPLLVGSNPPWRAAPAFVIEQPDKGLIIFDTGLSEAVARDGEAAYDFPLSWLIESRGHPSRILSAQMVAAGLEPDRVHSVILSHMHDDHIGDVAGFPNASFLVHQNANQSDVARKLPGNVKNISFAGSERLDPLGDSIDLFDDGSVFLISATGHTQEDMMAVLALPEGSVLLAGDAVVHFDWLASDDVERIAEDPVKAAKTRNAVRALLKQHIDVTLFPGHDLRNIPVGRSDIILHHPEWYNPNAWKRPPN